MLEGEVDAHLCQAFRAAAPDLSAVSCVDARRVTFFRQPRVVAAGRRRPGRGVGVPVWASRAAVRTLRLTGLDRLFDVRPPG